MTVRRLLGLCAVSVATLALGVSAAPAADTPRASVATETAQRPRSRRTVMLSPIRDSLGPAHPHARGLSGRSWWGLSGSCSLWWVDVRGQPENAPTCPRRGVRGLVGQRAVPG